MVGRVRSATNLIHGTLHPSHIPLAWQMENVNVLFRMDVPAVLAVWSSLRGHLQLSQSDTRLLPCTCMPKDSPVP